MPKRVRKTEAGEKKKFKTEQFLGALGDFLEKRLYTKMLERTFKKTLKKRIHFGKKRGPGLSKETWCTIKKRAP